MQDDSYTNVPAPQDATANPMGASTQGSGIGSYMKGSQGNWDYVCGAVRGSVGLGVKPLLMYGLSGTIVFMARVRVAEIPGGTGGLETYDDAFPEFSWEYNSGHHVRTHLRVVLKCGSSHEAFAEGIDEAADKIAKHISESISGANYQVMYDHLRGSWVTALKTFEKMDEVLEEIGIGSVVNQGDKRAKKPAVVGPMHFTTLQGTASHEVNKVEGSALDALMDDEAPEASGDDEDPDLDDLIDS